MGISFNIKKSSPNELEMILEGLNNTSSEDSIEKTIVKRESTSKLMWHKIEATVIKGDYNVLSLKTLFSFGYIDAKIIHAVESILKKTGRDKASERVGKYKERLCSGVVKEFDFFIKKYENRPEIKKIYEEELSKYKTHMGLDENYSESSKAISEGLKSIFFTNWHDSIAPCSRSMALSSHSTDNGPL